MDITEKELRAALAELRLWIKPEGQRYEGAALRGTILHHNDCADDIITHVQHARKEEN